ncbi:Lrp/AsnC family transcriptional regulator [Altererythrobacter arenosus]|uniref:Lrp/AsnC family transcriptional regulator n=1 Tax=Altererythrobacter arenosus TaxID=3032592 RepID=A0ABY8FTX3_9SPHN|nr:Lrp/AsnC family transcriptional regulator [Altererythrobacter sp. CAU 1644]WFL77540.1 Lrp/AsnC family transcriptional regulator [Altererythrobacter sp. CAU 1644]
MDKKDRQILRELQRNARLTNAELAERVHLSPSPCLRRVKNLEKAGVIERYVAVVNREAAGYPVTAFVQVTLAKHEGDIVKGFEQRMRDTPEVLACHVMTGNSDYLLEIVVSGLAAYEDFMREVMHKTPGIGTINTSLVYGTVKDTLQLP